MSFTYSLILFLTVIICFIASFDKRISFNKHFDSFIKSAIIIAIPFIAWDVYFTSIGVWWFNTDYTLGITISGLPLEEILFFIFIPFSCIFTYYAIDKFFKWEGLSAFNNLLVFISVVILTVIALTNMSKVYTFVTAILTVLTLIYLHFIARVDWITKASLVFTLLMSGFFPVNGVLTGTGLENPIVNYNLNSLLGIKILTIPIEDAVYGYTQFLLILYFFKIFQNQKVKSKSTIKA